MNTFYEIFKNCDTDKSVNYSNAYHECFDSIRNDVKLIFEIGVNRGGSVKGWKQYFPNALIVGIDIDKNWYFEDPEGRIKIEIGSANQKDFIENLIRKYGAPDIVIDDGSHLSSDIKDTYNLLYHFAKICYVIEDYGVQYKEFENGMYINDGVPATNIIHSKIDELLFSKDSVKSIKVYHSICLIFK
jgi:hypothetical protein